MKRDINRPGDFKNLYRQEIVAAHERWLERVIAMFKDNGLNMVITKSKGDNGSIFVTLNEIPMRIVKVKESGKNYIKMFFQQHRIILRYCPEFSLYNMKEIVPQTYFYSVEEVVDHFKKHDLVNKINHSLRNSARTGVFDESLNHLKSFKKLFP